MRNLKRVLALVMALVMALSLMVMGVSAASYTDADQIDADYSEAFEVLTNIGVIKGQDNGNGIVAAPKAILTRAEASTLVYRLLTGDVTDAQKKNYDFSSFDDVKEGEWWTGYITYAANGGYVVGDGNGMFRPEDEVTGIQVLTIMLRAIGYGQNGEYVGAGWKDNVLTDAKELGIIGSISTKDLDKGASRELVAQLLFNAITTPKMVTYSALLGYRTDRDATTLGDKTFGLVKVEGVLTANEKADLYGTKTLAAGKSKLDDKTTYNLTTDETLLGEKITFWAYGLKGAKTAITAPESLATVTDWSNGVPSAAQQKKIAAATTAATEIFYNYDPANTSDYPIYGKGILTKAIDNDGDGKYEYILNEKETFATVQYVSTSGVITLDKVNTGDNNQVAYDGIAVGDKVLVISYDGNSYIEKAAYVTGYISGVEYAASGNTATIGGADYMVSGIDYAVKNNTAVTQFKAVDDTYVKNYNGLTYDYFLDEYGNIIAYAKAGELDTEYALILDYDWYQTGAFTGDLWVKYLTTAGEVKTSIVDRTYSIYWNSQPGDVIKYRLNSDDELVRVYPMTDVYGTVQTDAALDLATVDVTDNSLDGSYGVTEDFVAFFYVSASNQGERSSMNYDRTHNAYYGVLTGADAIADLAVREKNLAQMDYVSGTGEHVDKYGYLKMVNINGYINAESQYCYLLSNKYFKSTSSLEEGTLYFYKAINAEGTPIDVVLTYTLPTDNQDRVWLYTTYTESTVAAGTYTYNLLQAVGSDYTGRDDKVAIGDMHSIPYNSSYLYIYDHASQDATEIVAPKVIADVSTAKGGTTELDSTYCAAGYVVYRQVGPKLVAVAAFVEKPVINEVTFIDTMIAGKDVHVEIGSKICFGTVYANGTYTWTPVGATQSITKDLDKDGNLVVEESMKGTSVAVNVKVPVTTATVNYVVKVYDKYQNLIGTYKAERTMTAAECDAGTLTFKLEVALNYVNAANNVTLNTSDYETTDGIIARDLDVTAGNTYDVVFSIRYAN
ncbi:MAG: S-layer homology domain-containing protein [Oscillospiraceae bacterium]